MQANSVNIGGTGSNFYFTDWDLVSQNEDGNYSSINWRSYFHFSGSDAQLDNGYTHVAGANRWHNGGRVKNYTGTFTHRDHFLASGSLNIGHDGNGNLTFHVAGGITPFQTPRSEAGANYSVPSLYRWAAPTHVEFANVTDTQFDFLVHTNRVVDIIAVSLQGGGNWIEFHGATTGRWMHFGNTGTGALKSGTTFPVRISLRRQASGYWQEHGNWNVTTLQQNNLFDLGDF